MSVHNANADTNAQTIASVVVRDLRSSVEWYHELLGRPAYRTRPEVAEWRFDRGGDLQVRQVVDRVGCGSVTLAVDSLDEQIAHLHRLGIDPGTTLVSGKARVVLIKDPDGNSIAFAQVTDQTEAH